MTQFDQLIKEKIDQKQYAYSAKAWHSFAQKAGWKASLTIVQSTIIAVLSIAILSVAGFFGYRFLTADKVAEVTPPAPTMPETCISVDTLVVAVSNNETVEIAPDTMPKISTEPVVKQTKPIVNEPTITPVTMPQNDTVTEEKEVKKVILRPKKPRRILEINTDTILTNE